MNNWLKKRLSPVKRDTARWYELAEALETLWESLFTEPYTRLSNLRSIYTADETGQLQKIAEYGPFYEQDMLTQNRPVYFGMRKREMLAKETTLPIDASIQRLGITGATWQPLYALESEPYGTRFFDRIRLNWEGNPANFLTSRGMLLIDFSLVNDVTLIPQLEERVLNLKPLHIIYDGMFYILPNTSAVPKIAAFLCSIEEVEIRPAEIGDLIQSNLITVAVAIHTIDYLTVGPLIPYFEDNYFMNGYLDTLVMVPNMF